jgi:hypothetical protein
VSVNEKMMSRLRIIKQVLKDCTCSLNHKENALQFGVILPLFCIKGVTATYSYIEFCLVNHSTNGDL